MGEGERVDAVRTLGGQGVMLREGRLGNTTRGWFGTGSTGGGSRTKVPEFNASVGLTGGDDGVAWS